MLVGKENQVQSLGHLYNAEAYLEHCQISMMKLS